MGDYLTKTGGWEYWKDDIDIVEPICGIEQLLACDDRMVTISPASRNALFVKLGVGGFLRIKGVGGAYGCARCAAYALFTFTCMLYSYTIGPYTYGHVHTTSSAPSCP